MNLELLNCIKYLRGYCFTKRNIPGFNTYHHNLFNIVFQIINKLYPNKAYDRYETGICMLKIRSDSIYRPLNIILETCLRCGYVSLGMGKSQYCSSWKKVISKPLKTTIMSHFYRFVVKYLNDCFIMKYLTLFRK